jgi:16S rRNA (cytosine967-C5)-methyltransferase
VLIQDEASQLVAWLAAPEPGARVLDVCAAPGGKTVAIAGAMGNDGLIVAIDCRPRRVALLRSTLGASGVTAARIVRADVSRGVPLGETFDSALVDAPCSGLGTVRRDPDIKWRRSEHDLGRFADAQLSMLVQSAEAVSRGGVLVYSTCSSEPEENEDVVRRFLGARNDFVHEDPRGSGLASPGLEAVLDGNGNLRTYPHVHGLEAFFASRLRRKPS